MRNKIHHITRTLRGKLSLWYLTSVGLIICIFLLALGMMFWFTLQDQIDHHIHITVNEAHDLVQNFRGEERDQLLKNLVSAQGMTIIVLSPDGAPVLETNSPDVAIATEHQLQKVLISASLDEPTPVHFTENGIRFAATPVQINAGKGILAVGYSTQVLYATFNKMFLIVASIVIFLVSPITFIGYKLIKSQLQPLESIAQQAQTISGNSTLKKRIHINSSSEELVTIQRAVNTMLAELERVFTSERQFFSDAAHTLKTPLAVLRSQVESASLAKKDKRELLKTIDATTETTTDLLLLSKIGIQSQDNKTISLSNLMKDLVELTSLLSEEKNLHVSSDIVNNIYINADKKLLQRALGNLAQNAVIYNHVEGNIELKMQEQQGQIVITIVDTGIGISKQDQKKLFARFFRGSTPRGKGSGLGLAISKAVIENLGGTIKLSSKLHKGTIVRILLPK